MGARRTKPDTDRTAPLGTPRSVPSASDLRFASEIAAAVDAAIEKAAAWM